MTATCHHLGKGYSSICKWVCQGKQTAMYADVFL